MASEQPGPEAVAGVGEEGGSGDVQTVRGQVGFDLFWEFTTNLIGLISDQLPSEK